MVAITFHWAIITARCVQQRKHFSNLLDNHHVTMSTLAPYTVYGNHFQAGQWDSRHWSDKMAICLITKDN